MPTGPDPSTLYPLPGNKATVFLKAVVRNPQIEVGDYTYFHSFRDPRDFEANVHYAFPFVGDRLVIGRFCAIASGATFLLNGGNHVVDAVSSYPFSIFAQGWEAARPDAWPNRGDIVVGNDVWIGFEATILPGIRVSDGAVIAARSVVTRDVPPYAIVAGNPARIVRFRQEEADIARLLALRWWDWPVERITRHLPIIATGSAAALERAAQAEDQSPGNVSN